MEHSPRAFVIMPFDSSLDSVYVDMIKSTLEEAGFTVERADDLLTSRNILDDIVAKIAEADLVVADLTDLNPNVFYELGLAHALNGRVLMMTQDISSLPFDLQSYRVLPYDTHFSRFLEARQRLREYADAAFSKSLQFGSPVSDFKRSAPDPAPGSAPSVVEQPESLEGGEAGVLDHMLDYFNSSTTLTGVLDEITSATQDIGAFVEEATGRLAEANSHGDPTMQVRASHAIIREVGLRTNEYARFLEKQNSAYEDALDVFGSSFEAALSAQPPQDDESKAQLEEQLAAIGTWRATIDESRASTVEYAETIHAMPRVEKYSSKANGHAYTQLQRFIGNLDKTSATLARIERVIRRLLEAYAPELEGSG